ncbi:nucleobase:cation symporter-2 family protein [Pseudobacteriovorax antillogorgiicola]|uniref:Nucleobase:cation symporter-2, NCS2 family n=1 Tax=Pseudobacteriovorax antillogorgiicola TaxID=1513793 RepID=A0A1Y6BT83_9BACT|nr:nucleobase:cation symporter-2 family protein [Pseudobacteriovorax antillogorgiicola]TCS52987.1 NCS2 family nucleobase:cation symporter-2 [Pseudobacteriovorax antillogorgiicola]SMF27310.1 nucleobase:cation symporter-2, NCS2 family [Pseudobacteriovorax antillogorgiicola]
MGIIARSKSFSNEQQSFLKSFMMGWQHVLVMYAGTIAVPLIVGRALNLPKEHLAFLINADLFAAGIITVIQSLGLGRFGIRLPVMMGVTFAAVGPMIAVGSDPNIGLTGIYGAVIIAGLFAILIAPLMGKLLPLFPPLVTGTIICLIGLSLLRVAIHWCAGGQPFVTEMIDGSAYRLANPEYGKPSNLVIAFGVLALILLINRYGKGMIKNLAVLLGLFGGTLVCALLGRINLHGIDDAPWLAITTPFHFGMPTFHLTAIASLCLVMVIVLAESMGMFLAVGNIVSQDVSEDDITRGLRADGLGTLIGGIFNTFPYTSFSQNVGLLSVTGVKSKAVTAFGGLILFGLGLFPKVAHVVASVPQYVLGGAGLVMFGMVAATGIRILASIDYEKQSHSLLVVAVSLSMGMVPTLSPGFFQYFPAWSHGLTHSGIVIGSVVAVLLNLFFNGRLSREQSLHLAAANTHSPE